MGKRVDFATRIDGVLVRKSQVKKYLDGSSIEKSNLSSHGNLIRRDFSVPFGFTAPLRLTRSRDDHTGLHFLRCTHGRIFAVFCDLRTGSPTELSWQGMILDGFDNKTLVVPDGVALGWQAIEEGEQGHASIEYTTTAQRNVSSLNFAWDDPALRIRWPIPPGTVPEPKSGYVEYASLQKSEFPTWRPASASSDQKPRTQTTNSHPSEFNLSPSASSQNYQAQTENRILVLGSNGPLGKHLVRSLSTLGTVIGGSNKQAPSDYTSIRISVDVSRPASIRQAIRDHQPSLIVNATSLTDSSEAERSPRAAQLINATAPEIIVDEATKVSASLIHFCSGQVFSGDGHRPWKENDTPRPAGQFARTKLQGTKAVLESDVPHLVFRTGWLYSTLGENSVSRTLDSLTYRNQLSMSETHYGTPTCTGWLAQTITEILLDKDDPDLLQMWMKEYGGLYHLTPTGFTNKLGLADYLHSVASQQNLPVVTRNIVPLAQTDEDLEVDFNGNERLDSTKFASTFSVRLPRWQDLLLPQISELAKMPQTQSVA